MCSFLLSHPHLPSRSPQAQSASALLSWSATASTTNMGPHLFSSKQQMNDLLCSPKLKMDNLADGPVLPFWLLISRADWYLQCVVVALHRLYGATATGSLCGAASRSCSSPSEPAPRHDTVLTQAKLGASILAIVHAGQQSPVAF